MTELPVLSGLFLKQNLNLISLRVFFKRSQVSIMHRSSLGLVFDYVLCLCMKGWRSVKSIIFSSLRAEHAQQVPACGNYAEI